MLSRSRVAFGVSLVASIAWWACSNSAGGGGVPDGGEAGEDATVDVATGEGGECNPCSQICACTPGEPMYSAALCMKYTCPPTGVWGPLGCAGPSMCADASDGQGPAMDATTEAAADAPSDAQPDAPADAVSEAGEASEASEASGD